jgi:hypothetical protein
VVVRPADLEAARAALADPPVIDAAAGALRVALPPAECARRLVAAGVDVVELAPARTLEDAFQRLTGGSGPQPTGGS